MPPSKHYTAPRATQLARLSIAHGGGSSVCLSQYDRMMLEVDSTHPGYLFLAGFLSWLLLAGFLVSPSTYASARESDALDDTGKVGQSLMSAVRNVPLLYIASFACLIATAGLGWLWWRWRHNYVWVKRYVIV